MSVADTGVGINESDKLKIFEEFYQAEELGGETRSGTGLGLPISKRIIELHGGRIWAASNPGGGSIFSLELPVRVDRQADAP